MIKNFKDCFNISTKQKSWEISNFGHFYNLLVIKARTKPEKALKMDSKKCEQWKKKKKMEDLEEQYEGKNIKVHSNKRHS